MCSINFQLYVSNCNASPNFCDITLDKKRLTKLCREQTKKQKSEQSIVKVKHCATPRREMRQPSTGEDLIREGLDGLPDLRVAEEVELVQVVVQLVQLLSPFEPFLLRYLFDKEASEKKVVWYSVSTRRKQECCLGAAVADMRCLSAGYDVDPLDDASAPFKMQLRKREC